MNRRVFLVSFGALIGTGAVNSISHMLTGEYLLAPDGTNTPTQNIAQNKPATTTGAWTLPARGTVGTTYGVPGTMWASGHHTGIDFTVPENTKVYAAFHGVVVAAGWGGAYGNQIVLHHDGVYTQYAHLKTISVKEGQTVVSGQEIGRSGSTGNSTGAHLHFEVRTGPKYGSDIDPMKYLGEKGVRL